MIDFTVTSIVAYKLSFIFMAMYLGVSCLSLHVLLYQTAAFVLYSFLLMFLYKYIPLACLAFIYKYSLYTGQ